VIDMGFGPVAQFQVAINKTQFHFVSGDTRAEGPEHGMSRVELAMALAALDVIRERLTYQAGKLRAVEQPVSAPFAVPYPTQAF
jgi:hypothetical protein